MALAPGTRLGPYEVVAALGQGGMGEVYRARDTRLDRTVALKVIAGHRLADPQMRQRFDREARAVAALSHPHICHLNDVGHDAGLDFLVMEYLEGETLAARLARASASASPALPPDELFRYAIQIAEALAEAHRHGIVHRDLKPGNVILTKTGAKLLDFGLAKLLPTIAGTAGLSTQGPTREAPLTGEGSILGTWPYMAPEQLEGKDTDARTDIFAFGAVLYELATGSRAFAGDSHASLIAAIMGQDPQPFASRARATPPALERVVRKCLAKQPDARWQTARDLADALKWVDEERQSVVGPADDAPALAPARRRVWPWVAAIAAAAGLGAAVVWNLPRQASSAPVVRRFVIQPPPEARANLEFALSPDGRALVYRVTTGQGSALYLRPIDQVAARPIPGTKGGFRPTFSPDGEWVAFLADGKLKKVSRSSGAPPIALADFAAETGIEQSIAWLADKGIVLGQFGQGLLRVPAEGGTPVRLTKPDRAQGEIDHHNPRALPGGRALLITRHRGSEAWDVAVLHLDTGRINVVVPDAFDARYVPTGHLVFARGEALLAAPFDVDRLEVTGPAAVMVDHVLTSVNNGVARYGVADDGSLAYMPPQVITGRRLVWAGPKGPPEPLPIGPHAFSRPSLSPDGRRVAVQIDDGSRRDIWIYDLRLGTLAPFTQDGASEAPIWTPDGERLTFSTSKGGRREIFGQPVDRRSPPELLVTDTVSVWPGSWFPDGRRLAFTRQPPTDENDIGVFDAQTRRSEMVITNVGEDIHPRVSPDGKWLSYTSEESGRSQAMVMALGGDRARRQVSTDGGGAPVWTRDGRLLYWHTGSWVAVEFRQFPASIGKPTLVVTGVTSVPRGVSHPGYDVAADGRLLIVQVAEEESAPRRFEIVLNWFEELKQRVPRGK